MSRKNKETETIFSEFNVQIVWRSEFEQFIPWIQNNKAVRKLFKTVIKNNLSINEITRNNFIDFKQILVQSSIGQIKQPKCKHFFGILSIRFVSSSNKLTKSTKSKKKLPISSEFKQIKQYGTCHKRAAATINCWKKKK